MIGRRGVTCWEERYFSILPTTSSVQQSEITHTLWSNSQARKFSSKVSYLSKKSLSSFQLRKLSSWRHACSSASSLASHLARTDIMVIHVAWNGGSLGISKSQEVIWFVPCVSSLNTTTRWARWWNSQRHSTCWFCKEGHSIEFTMGTTQLQCQLFNLVKQFI